MSVDGRIIAIIITLILVCLGAMFGFGYLYGSSICEPTKCQSTQVQSQIVDPQQQLVNNIEAIVNSNEGFHVIENLLPTCHKYNSKYKIMMVNLLDFLSDQNGQFSTYFKYEDEFGDDVDETINKQERRSSLRSIDTPKESIIENNRIVIDKINNFRNKIITGVDLDYYQLFKEFFGGVTGPLDYGSIWVTNGLSKPISSLSDADITIIASNMVFNFLPLLLIQIWELGSSVKYELIFYDKQTDEIVYHPDFRLLMSDNDKFFSEKIQGKISQNLVKAEFENNLIKPPKENFIKDIISLIEKNNPGTSEADIEQNIINMKMEKIFKDQYDNFQKQLMMFGTTKITELFKNMIRNGNFGGGGQMQTKPAFKYNTTKYFQKIDSANINTLPKCS
jgi:hypothetical protein